MLTILKKIIIKNKTNCNLSGHITGSYKAALPTAHLVDHRCAAVSQGLQSRTRAFGLVMSFPYPHF